MKTRNTILSSAILTLALSASTVAQADGFFSNLFGGSKDGADFKELMAHVPADTAYLIANKKPLPEKVIDFQMGRAKEMMSLLSESSELKKAAKAEGPGKFFTALFSEYSDVIAKGKLEDSGLSTKSNSLIYGYEMMPVMRIGVKDKEKVMAMIKRAEEKSGYKIEFTKCGKFDCFNKTDDKGPMSVSIVFLEDHVAVSAFTTENKEKLSKHLIGEAKPKTSFSEDKWDAFLKENTYEGYGDGFIDLKKIFAFSKPLIAANMKGAMDDAALQGCLTVAEQHVENMPEILIGTKNAEEKAMDYELLIKTSANVSTALQTLANTSNIAQRSENSIIEYGVNINFSKLRDALTQYSSFLIASGESNKCPMIKAQDIRKSMGGMAMVMNMGLSQFNSIYASLTDIKMNDKMQPEKVDAIISLGSNDPAGLLSMAGMMSPALMTLKIPEDGTPVKLPEGAIPSRGAPIPDIFLSRGEKALNIMIGNDKPTLKAHKNDTAEISFSSMDINRYMNVFSGIMDAMPASAKQSADAPDMEMLKKIGKLGGKMFSTTSADKRGLVVNYHLEY